MSDKGIRDARSLGTPKMLLLGFQHRCDCGLAGSVEGAESGEKSLFFIRNVLSKHLIIKIAQR